MNKFEDFNQIVDLSKQRLLNFHNPDARLRFSNNLKMTIHSFLGDIDVNPTIELHDFDSEYVPQHIGLRFKSPFYKTNRNPFDDKKEYPILMFDITYIVLRDLRELHYMDINPTKRVDYSNILVKNIELNLSDKIFVIEYCFKDIDDNREFEQINWRGFHNYYENKNVIYCVRHDDAKELGFTHETPIEVTKQLYW